MYHVSRVLIGNEGGFDLELGLIRIGGHLSYGGYDVQTDGLTHRSGGDRAARVESIEPYCARVIADPR